MYIYGVRVRKKEAVFHNMRIWVLTGSYVFLGQHGLTQQCHPLELN